jgi:hypothetical protein
MAADPTTDDDRVLWLLMEQPLRVLGSSQQRGARSSARVHSGAEKEENTTGG